MRQRLDQVVTTGGATVSYAGNREIAARLGIDERSAEGHVERIRLRLGFRSRAQIAAWFSAQQL